jgi:hypothetical protein
MNPFDEDEIEMCSNCFEDEEYDFGLCVACVELAMEEIEEMEIEEYKKSFQNPLRIVK